MYFAFLASFSIGGLYSVTIDFLQDAVSCAGGFSLASKQSRVESPAKRINFIALTEQNEDHILIEQNCRLSFVGYFPHLTFFFVHIASYQINLMFF